MHPDTLPAMGKQIGICSEQNTQKLLLTEKEAARLLSVSPSFLRQARMEGNRPLTGRTPAPPFIRIGKRGVRYSLLDLYEWIELQKVR